jgi:hypothetical protein
VAHATGRLNLEELDRLDLTARQDSVFAIDKTRLSLKLWPRTKKGEVNVTSGAECVKNCTGFASGWSLRTEIEQPADGSRTAAAAASSGARLYDASARISAWRSAFSSQPTPGKSGIYDAPLSRKYGSTGPWTLMVSGLP